ncbi:methyltransferase [Erythrobacter rubeus]|uniref:Methyltransferase n=1 Tax=Erythrobacter rubeus TaxID=2760803 RepID=A0ABR8KQZ9_9SPHN|nr:methyltransferase [Erythrobacter rubeus]MBD2841837.1 methyltransferase [Erythrobacter rubeus]
MNTAPPQIFNRQRAAAKWARARDRRQGQDTADYLIDSMAEDIAERLDFMRVEAKKPLLVGPATATLSDALASPADTLKTAKLGEFDEERPSPFKAHDLIVHLLGLGMVNDLPGALIHARNSLVEGGLFMAAFPGAGSVPVLRKLTLAADGDRPAARIHPQVDNRAGSALLERAGFARQVVDSYPIRVRFSSLDRMISDLRDHGLTSSLASAAPPITREEWQHARAAFDEMRDADGKVTETFEILTLTGWR